MNSPIKAFYSQKTGEYEIQLKSVTKKLKRFGWYRFFSFLLIFAPLFIFGLKSWFTFIVSPAAAVLFLFLVKSNIKLDKTKKKTTILKKIAEEELLAIEHQFSHFKDGKEFLNTDHFFSYDLDLFGEGSLFQYLNRSSTITGQQKLAGWLINPAIEKEEIIKKQEAVRELASIPEWRLHFLANGKMFEETSEMHNEILSWAGMELKLKSAGQIKWLIIVIPSLTFVSALPAILGFSNLFLMTMIFIQWIFLLVYWMLISQYFRFFGRKSELLSKYMHLLHFIEEKEFKSALLTEMQNRVRMPESAGSLFRNLNKLVGQFEYRQNMLIGFFMNSFLLWDIRCVYRLWNWHKKNHDKLAGWLDVISETDALISLANYANNHPYYVYPEIQEDEFVFSARNLGHPLLNESKRICNNFEIRGWSKVMIVTGANMAGKSTFLRTVGVNLILACTGVPVCANELTFTPVGIYTNMRTTDSLLKDESYFFAELKRIKGVLELLQKGEKIFVILDEMLKGTNSIDKLNGSKELIRKLIELKAVSLIATHDLKLSEMENEFPDQVYNKCFEIRIENDELVFDYKLSDGVTKTMNATFLMKKMGII